MLMYFYGPDTYRRKQRIDAIAHEYQKKYHPIRIEHFMMAKDKEVERLATFIKGQSLFEPQKCAVIHDPEEAEGLPPILKLALDDDSTTLLIVSDKKLGTGFPFLFKKPVIVESFDLLKGDELISTIRTIARGITDSVPETTIQLLAQTHGGDLWAIVSELEKMALGAPAEKRVTIPPFFPLVQKLKAPGSPGARLSALAYLLESEEPAAIFNITAAISDGALKTKMADYDVAIKSGKLDYEEILLDLAIG